MHRIFRPIVAAVIALLAVPTIANAAGFTPLRTVLDFSSGLSVGTPTATLDDGGTTIAVGQGGGAALGTYAGVLPGAGSAGVVTNFRPGAGGTPYTAIGGDGRQSTLTFVGGLLRWYSFDVGSWTDRGAVDSVASIYYMRGGDDGTITAVWGTSVKLEVGTLAPGATQWQTSFVPGSGTDASSASALHRADGSLVVCWTDVTSTGGTSQTNTFRCSARSAAGAWDAAPQVLDSVTFDVSTHFALRLNPRMVLAPDGTAVVASGLATFANTATVFPTDLLVRSRSESEASFGHTTVALTNSDPVNTEEAVLAIDRDGSQVVVAPHYSSLVGSGTVDVVATQRAAGAGSFDPAVTLGAANPFVQATVGRTADGTIIAAWLPKDTDRSIRAAVRPDGAGATFDTPRVVDDTSPTRTLFGVVANRVGDASIMVRDIGASSSVGAIRRIGYSASPPRIGDVAAPGATAGRASALSVTIAANFDAAPSVTWAFDDGGTASGATVTHAWAAAGLHTLTITAADAYGNTASAARTVLVALPPVSAPATVVVRPSFLPARKSSTKLVRGRYVVTTGLTLRCAGPRACGGTVALTTKVRVKVGKKTRTKTVTIATARLSVKAGRTSALVLTLTRAGGVLLLAHHPLTTTLTAKVTGSAPVTLARAVRVPLPTKPKAHH